MIQIVPVPVRVRVTAIIVVAAIVVVTLFMRAPLIALLVLWLGVRVLWIFWPRLRFACNDVKNVFAGKGINQQWQLTFDDGPTPGLTERILDLLRRHNIQASFFVLTEKAKKNPELVRRMIQEGHIVGLHGIDHRKPFFKGTNRLCRDLKQGARELELITGQPIVFYRPSHGWKTISLVRAVHSAGLRFCFWDYGVWDTDNPQESELTERLRLCLSQGFSRLKRSAVILMHDGRGDEPGLPPHAGVLVSSLSSLLNERAR